MPRGYWRIVFAVVGCLALCGAKPPQKQAQSANSGQSADPSDKATFTPYGGYDPGPCYHAASHDAADLCAQWRAAIAAEKATHEARRATTWSIVATLLNAIGLIAVGAALYLTIISNRIARDTAMRQLRPYLSIEHIGYFGIKADADSPTFSISVQNSGQTPAFEYRGYSRCYIDHRDHVPNPIPKEKTSSLIPVVFGPGEKGGHYDAPFNVSPADRGGVLSGTHKVFIVSVFEWKDGFDQWYRLDAAFASTDGHLRAMTPIFSFETKIDSPRKN